MSISTPAITNPVLLDRALGEIGTKLAANLSWLTTAYGIAVREEDTYEGRKRTYPAIRIDAESYEKLLPDQELGNYSFFECLHPEQVEWHRRLPSWQECKFSTIFQFDFRTVYPADHNNRTLEHVKLDILRVFRNMSLSKSVLEIELIYDKIIDVYQTYSFVYTDPDWIGIERIALQNSNYFFRRPFGCLRFEGKVRYLESDDVIC